MLPIQNPSGRLTPILLFGKHLQRLANQLGIACILQACGATSVFMTPEMLTGQVVDGNGRLHVLSGDSLDLIANADPKVINNIKPTKVVCKAMADSSVNICLWAWVKQEDYWEVFFRLNEQVYSKFGENGIEIAFPQVQVHMSKD